MENTPIQNDTPQVPSIRKGCHISIMFPVEDDAEALAVKKGIDACIPDVEGRRYTFQITEM
jgi:hypothetical protein